MDDAEDVARWALTESTKLQETDPIGSPMEERVLETWRTKRPKMVAELARYGAVEALAHVLVERCLETEKKLLQSGLPLADAREQAERDWLMLQPEEEDEAT